MIPLFIKSFSAQIDRKIEKSVTSQFPRAQVDLEYAIRHHGRIWNKQAKREGGTRKSSASKQLIGLSEFSHFPPCQTRDQDPRLPTMTHCKQLHTLHTNTDRMDPRSLPSNIFFSFRACQAFFLLLLCYFFLRTAALSSYAWKRCKFVLVP